MIAKQIGIGLLVGLIANVAGMFLYVQFFIDKEFETALADAFREGVLGNIIGLGAIFNFLPFFVFLKKKKIYRSRGVLLATLIAAIAVMILEIGSIFG
jgi:uncharacterized BrkB/YihY/UPF0761 family membrane protein